MQGAKCWSSQYFDSHVSTYVFFRRVKCFRMPRRGAVYEACRDATSSRTEPAWIAEALRHQTAAAIHAQLAAAFRLHRPCE